MNMNRSWTPPDNAKILPDMYNILDAHTLKRTSNINGMLNYQLSTKQNVISRNKSLAERVHKEEKARVANALNHIQDKLPAVGRIRDFDVKFFNNKQFEEDLLNKKTKSYQGGTNEESTCRRCYIHHLPLKKKFYNRSPLPPLSRNRPLPPMSVTSTSMNKDYSLKSLEQGHENGENEDHLLQQLDTTTHNFAFSPTNRVDVDESGGKRTPLSSMKQGSGWWMPDNKTYQFLKKDKSGREMDVNKYYTPRLMPYEDWKNVVQDVCYHYHKSMDGLHTL